MSKITAVLIAAGISTVACGDFEPGAAVDQRMAVSAEALKPAAQAQESAADPAINPSLEELAAWPVAASRGR